MYHPSLSNPKFWSIQLLNIIVDTTYISDHGRDLVERDEAVDGNPESEDFIGDFGKSKKHWENFQ